MYIMYSLVCCGTRKRIHNIDNCGIWFVCVYCAVAHVSLYIKHWYGSGSLWRTVCVILNSLYVGCYSRSDELPLPTDVQQ